MFRVMTASNRLRTAIIRLHTLGHAPARIAETLRLPRMTVYRAIKRFEELGTSLDRPRRGRPRTARTTQLIETVRSRINRNARRSIRQMAQQLPLSRTSLGRIVTEELGLRSYRTRKAAFLSARNKSERVKRCRDLLRRTQQGEHFNMVFSDEKLFTVEEVHNSQNVRVLAKDAEQADSKGRTVQRSAHPTQVMVWAGICATGKTPLVFVEKGVKIDTEYYLKHVLQDVLHPWSQSHFNQRTWTFQQDSAPAHKAKKVQTWCKENFPGFITTAEWPASSPDLNPLDYSVWAYLESKVNSRSHPNIDSLKNALQAEWDNIGVEYLRTVVEAFPKRLRAVVRAKGDRLS